MTSLSGKVALVTGAGRGIGRGIAVGLGHEGASVVVNYRSDDAVAAEVVEEITALGAKAIAIRADVSDRTEIASLFEQAEKHFGKLDVVVLNAAGHSHGSIAEATEDDFDVVFNTNARGTFFCLQESARRVADGGSIVVISASGVGGASLGLAIYHASKASEEHFVRVLAREIGHRGVRVNSVSPGPTNSKRLTGPSDIYEQYEKATDLGRVGEIEDVADVIIFLGGDGARWVTGQNLRANGGFHPL